MEAAQKNALAFIDALYFKLALIVDTGNHANNAFAFIDVLFSLIFLIVDTGIVLLHINTAYSGASLSEVNSVPARLIDP